MKSEWMKLKKKIKWEFRFLKMEENDTDKDESVSWGHTAENRNNKIICITRCLLERNYIESLCKVIPDK